MSQKFSSTQNTTNLKEFIEKIPSRGIPAKVNIPYLQSIGYKSNNDRTIVAVLKSIGLVESNGIPSEHFSKLRSSKGKTVLAQLIKNTYSELFEIYPNAQSQQNSNLKDYFASVTNVGEASLKNIINTFQALCTVADFSNSNIPNEASVVPQAVSVPQINTVNSQPTHLSNSNSQIHFNIQVHIPGEQSPETYEAIFKNLGKYVLGIKESN